MAGYPIPIVENQPEVQSRIDLSISELQLDSIEQNFESSRIENYQDFRNRGIPTYVFSINNQPFEKNKAILACREQEYRYYALHIDGLDNNGFSFTTPEDCFSFVYTTYQRLLSGEGAVPVYLDWKSGQIVVDDDTHAMLIHVRHNGVLQKDVPMQFAQKKMVRAIGSQEAASLTD